MTEDKLKDNLVKFLPLIVFLVIILAQIFKDKFFLVLMVGIGLYLYITGKKKHAFKDIFNQINRKQEEESNIIDVKFTNYFKNMKKGIFLIIVAIFGIWLFAASIIVVDAGETGVYSLFGKVKDEEYSSGFHLVIPFAKITKMSIRTEEYTMSIATAEGKKYGDDSITSLTKEGLSVELDITILYRLDEKQASEVYKNLGSNYEEKIIRPAIRTSIRDVIAKYEAKDIYSEKRQEVASEIMAHLDEDTEARGIVIEDVLLRNVKLPNNLANSIQEKLQAEQEAEKYDFLLQTEKKEKERKIIEAEGQRDAQKIINESLSTNYLYYLYINQLKDRAGTIYVPTSPDTGMPLFREVGQ